MSLAQPPRNVASANVCRWSAATISNDGAARYVITDGPAGMPGEGTSQRYEAGLRHSF